MKKRIFILCLAICLLFTLSSVCAGDVNDTAIAGEDADQTIDDELSAGASDDALGVSSDDNVIMGDNRGWYVNASAADGGDGSSGTPYNSFKNVLDNADLQDGDSVYFAGGENYVGENNVNLTINKQLNLLKYGSGDAIFDAEKNSRIFRIIASCINITGLTFVNGNADYGGAIYFENAISNSNIDATYINNTADEGGANYFYNPVSVSTIGGTYENNTAGEGGANYFADTVSNSHITGTYNNNTASTDGGANYFAGTVSNSTVGGTYTENKANGQDSYNGGGANYFYFDVSNSTVGGTYTENKANGQGSCDGGGANYFYDIVSNSTICGTYDHNAADKGGANYFYDYVSDSTIGGTYGYNAAVDGGANYFYNPVSGSAICGTYDNNTAGKGAANYFLLKVSNSNITGTYVNNTATDDGGANYFYNAVSGSNITGTYVNNTATGDGGANCFYDPVSDSTIGGTYYYNNATDGGANLFIDTVSNSSITGTYGYNTATNCGGANYFNQKVLNSTIGGTYGYNTAEDDGGANYFNREVSNSTIGGTYGYNTAEDDGGANFFDEAVSDVVLTGNYINNTGGNVICLISASGNVIRDSIFLNNAPILVYSNDVNAINVWFGNNATNYDVKPDAGDGVVLSNWLFLNATAPDVIFAADTSNIVFKLASYDGENVSAYDNSRMLPIDLAITSTSGSVNPEIAGLDENIAYTPDSSGRGSVTATVENVFCTIEFGIEKSSPDLSVGFQEFTYGESITLAINYRVNATGKVNITLKGKNGNHTFTNVELNTTILLADAINAGEYEVTVAYSGDGRFMNATAESTLKINKADSTLTVNDIAFDYMGSGSTAISFTGATGVSASVENQTGAIVNVAGNTITVSGLDAGEYTLTVTTMADSNHNSITKTANITVNALQTQITANAITATYNVNKNLVITLKDAKGNALSGASVTVDLNGVKTYVTDKNGQIRINVAKLVPKAYAAKITFAGNANYKASSAAVKVTVNKAKSTITAKKKTFKKAKKVKKYTITLKSGKAAIKKVQVTLKIKGKTYKAKTNAKGKATFKIKKLTKKGTFKATIKFKGNKYYKAVTKKVKIKIK